MLKKIKPMTRALVIEVPKKRKGAYQTFPYKAYFGSNFVSKIDLHAHPKEVIKQIIIIYEIN